MMAPPAWPAGTIDSTRGPAHPPYAEQQELIDDRLAAIRARLFAAGDHVAASSQHDRARTPWPADLLAAEARIEQRAQLSRRLPIRLIAERFALTASEDCVLWLLIAHELCPIARQLIRGLTTEQTADPTTDAIRRVVYGRGCAPRVWRELGPDGSLRRFGFIARSDDGGDLPVHRQTWALAARVVALVHGDLALDRALHGLVSADDVVPRVDELELAGDAADRIADAFDRGDLVIAHGRAGSGRRSILAATGHARGLKLLRIDGRAIAREREPARDQLRAIARECRLLALTPLVEHVDALAAAGDAPDRIDLIERELPGLVLATADRAIARRWQRAPTAIELGPLAGAQRARLWARAIPAAGPGDAEILATMYPLAPALIEAAGKQATEQCGGGAMKPHHIEAGLRAVLDDRLAGLASRVITAHSWDDLVLPDDQAAALGELLARIRERRRVYEDWGFGDRLGGAAAVAALLSGPPGTGKTMAAGLVARALRLELYQVDLSKIVSKWIGETEKNLAALFDAAEAGHAVLLFDEADALFGKRTEIRSANDRHANQEVNFLLQRLDRHAGVCILTTNHEAAIDDAFRRRLTVHVRFPLPDVRERERLWRALIPAAAPCAGELGLAALAASYAMSGGHIRNAVVRAAFLAADEGGPIDGARLARAAQLEYEALGKLVHGGRDG